MSYQSQIGYDIHPSPKGRIVPLKDDYLTVSEAAAALQCDVSTIRRHVGKSLPADKVGNSWIIKRSDLDTWSKTHLRKRGRPPKLGT